MINTIATLDNTVFRVAGFCPDSLFCRRGAHYKQEQCVSLFPRPGNHMFAMFFCLLLSTCKVKYFLNCLDTIPQNN